MLLSLVNTDSPALKHHVHICPASTHHNGSLQPFLLLNLSSVLHHLLQRPESVLSGEFLKIPKSAYNAIVVVTLPSV
jgi:hypothetical protein